MELVDGTAATLLLDILEWVAAQHADANEPTQPDSAE
jgi:hypothetical protein